MVLSPHREIPMNDIVYRSLLALKKADGPWVFCKKNGERYGNVRKAFEGAKRQLWMFWRRGWSQFGHKGGLGS